MTPLLLHLTVISTAVQWSGEIPRPNGISSMVAGDFSAQSLNRTKGMIIHNHMKHRSKWQFDTCRSVIAFIKTKSSFKRSCFSSQRNPVPFHPLCPMSSVSAWSTAAAVLWHDGARQAGLSRHFCRDRWRNPGFLCCFLFTWSGREWKRLTHGRLPSILASPMAILGIYGWFLSILQVFHIPLLY